MREERTGCVLQGCSRSRSAERPEDGSNWFEKLRETQQASSPEGRIVLAGEERERCCTKWVSELSLAHYRVKRQGGQVLPEKEGHIGERMGQHHGQEQERRQRGQRQMGPRRGQLHGDLGSTAS